MTLSLLPLFTPAAIGIFLLFMLLAFLADTYRNKRRKKRESYPSATIRRVELDESEHKISD